MQPGEMAVIGTPIFRLTYPRKSDGRSSHADSSGGLRFRLSSCVSVFRLIAR